MKKLALIFFLMPFVSFAQIEAEATSSRQNFLLYEAVDLNIRLKNTSAEEVILDNGLQSDNPWLSFLIFKANGEKIESDNLFLPSSYVLAPGEERQFLVNITPWYRMRETGQYKIQAAVRLNSGKTFVTSPLKINIGSGNVISKNNRNINGTERVYSLISFFDQQKLKLYLRIEEPRENIVYITRLLGPYNPSLKIKGPLFDSRDRLHVLHPKDNQQFCYTLTDKEGNVLAQKDVSSSAQLLQKDNGEVELQSVKR